MRGTSAAQEKLTCHRHWKTSDLLLDTDVFLNEGPATAISREEFAGIGTESEGESKQRYAQVHLRRLLEGTHVVCSPEQLRREFSHPYFINGSQGHRQRNCQ